MHLAKDSTIYKKKKFNYKYFLKTVRKTKYNIIKKK